MNRLDLTLASLFLMTSFGLATTAARAEPVDLSGSWQFQIDPDDEGVAAGWFGQPLDGSIRLPGTTSMAKAGQPLELAPEMTKQVLRGLHQRHEYIGPAWYSRDVEVPADWSDRPVQLLLERVIWTTDVWLDGKKVGRATSLSTPQVINLGMLSAGSHKLSLRVDNREFVKVGESHAYTDETQSIWNGIVGRIELQAIDPVRVTKARVDHVDGNDAALQVRLVGVNDTGSIASKRVSITITPAGQRAKATTKEMDWDMAVGQTETKVVVELDESLASWDEFNPTLHTVSVSLGDDESFQQTFGLRVVGKEPMTMLLDGKPIFLRGTLDNAAYPLTGHPPMNEAEWINIFTIAKRWGLNHVRYHSWCPPEAAFNAADKVGIYLQPELPYWGFAQLERDGELHNYLREEGRRIFDAYGHHPSFMMFSLGNELYGPFDVLHELVEEFRAYEDNILMTTTTFSFAKGHGRWPEPVDDFFLTQRARDGWVRGQGFFNEQVPGTDKDYRESIVDFPVPLISHEIGQYPVYPQLSEIEKYSGVLDPTNFEAIRDDLNRKGRLHMAEAYTRASGKFAALLYKEEIERALRTPNLSGFQLLDLHDFPGQSTALVGLLDVFWDSKGLIEAEDFREFCGPIVPLLRMPKRIYTAGETLTFGVEVSHYGPDTLPANDARWRVVTDDGVTLDSGTIAYEDLAAGGLRKLGTITTDSTNWPAPKAMKVQVSLDATDLRNEWRLWVYSKQETAAVPKSPEVIVADRLDEATLKHLDAGGRVLLNPSPRLLAEPQTSNFTPVFWSPLHFENQPTTMGLLVQPSHPALFDFPTDAHSDWQWWDLTAGSTGMALDKLGDQTNTIRPIVQYVDDFGGNLLIGAIWEAKVGNGEVLVCTFDISNNLEERPAANQLRHSLVKYIATSSFRPQASLTLDELQSLFREPTSMHDASVVSVSSFQSGYESKNVLDGDPTTLWHTSWNDAGAAYPHEIVIDLGKARVVDEIIFTHRGDGNINGRVGRFNVYLSDQADTWGQPILEATFDASATRQAFRTDGVNPNDPEAIYESADAKPVRYVRVEALTSQGESPHASFAEIEVVSP